jgi:CheY-like chemotaxis protein
MSHAILLVDDDRDLRTLMSLILKHAGYDIYQAANGHEALQITETTAIDLFIVDVMMPEMNGFELCVHLRANPNTENHPIFLLSARKDRDSINEGLASGASLYLTKPIETPDLIDHIKQYLAEDSHQQP